MITHVDVVVLLLLPTMYVSNTNKSCDDNGRNNERIPYFCCQIFFFLHINTNMEELFIHDNGGRPFRVDVDKTNETIRISVYQNENSYSFFQEFSYKKYFVGQGTYDSVEYCKFSYGNSVLVHLGDLEYLYIGCKIWKFTAQAEIISFVGTACNSDVVYAYCVDTDRRYYFFEGYDGFEYLNFIPETLTKPREIYRYFYDQVKPNDRITVTTTIIHNRVL